MLKRLTTRVGERGLDAALTAHRGSAPPVRHATAEQHARPGKGQQTVPTETGPWDLVRPPAARRHGRSRAAWERWTGVLDDPPDDPAGGLDDAGQRVVKLGAAESAARAPGVPTGRVDHPRVV